MGVGLEWCADLRCLCIWRPDGPGGRKLCPVYPSPWARWSGYPSEYENDGVYVARFTVQREGA